MGFEGRDYVGDAGLQNVQGDGQNESGLLKQCYSLEIKLQQVLEDIDQCLQGGLMGLSKSARGWRPLHCRCPATAHHL